MLLTFITFGVYMAWAQVAFKKYIYKETELEGKRFEYQAKGIDVFIGYLKAFGILVLFFALMAGGLFLGKGNIFITFLFTFVIYAAFLSLLPIAIHGSLKYEMAMSAWDGINFGYRGDRGTLVKEFLVGMLLTVFTLGIYGSWFSVNLKKYITGNIRFGSISFSYHGEGKKLLLINLKGILFTILTVGIYMFWYIAEVYRYHTNHTKAYQNGREIQFVSNVTGLDVLSNSIVNMVLIIVTFGIAIPWVICRDMEFMYGHLVFEGDFRGHELQQTEISYSNATGSGLAEILDINS